MKIIIIEDERPVRQLLAEYLKNLEVEEIIECAHGQSALDKMQEINERLSAIFLDINMEGMDGLDFLQEFMASCPHQNIPVFVITGDPCKEKMKTCFRHEIYSFVEKPFEQKQIADCISIARRIEEANSAAVSPLT